MKGLILKDIYSTQLSLILGILIMLFPGIMMMLLGGGMNVGMPNDFIGAIPYALLGYCNIVCLSSVSLNTFVEDESSGWSKLQGIMPVTRGEITRAKFISALITVGILTGISLLSSLLGTIMFKIPLEPMLTIPLCLALFEISVLFATIAVNLRYGARFSSIAYITLVLLGSAAMIGMLFVALYSSAIGLMIRLVFYVGLPIITGAVTLAAYRCSIRALESK